MGLFNPGLSEASVFVFENYGKKQKLGKPNPPLLPVLKSVTKHFNAYGNPEARFNVDELMRYYARDKLSGFSDKTYRPTRFGRQMFLAGYGLGTLPGAVGVALNEWTETGDTALALSRIENPPAAGKRRHGALAADVRALHHALKG